MDKNLKIFTITGIILLLVVFGFLYSKNTPETIQSKEEVSLNKILQEQFDNKYKTIVSPVNNYLITLVTTSCPYGDSPFGDTCNSNDKQSPLIVIQDSKTEKVQSIFEVGFKHTNNTKLNTGNNILLRNYEFTNDTFKDFGFLTEWFIWWGGSSGFKGMAMFSEQGGRLLPVNGYFGKTSSESNLTLTDKLTGQAYTFPVITDSYFTHYDDLNKDGYTCPHKLDHVIRLEYGKQKDTTGTYTVI